MSGRDFADFVGALLAHDVRFLVVGAHALAVHGVPRATGDLDIWVARNPENAERVWSALIAFGAPASSLGVDRADLERDDVIVQLGLPPYRIDVLTALSGVEFGDCWQRRALHQFEGHDTPFISRDDLRRNKLATGRTRDLADVEALDEVS